MVTFENDYSTGACPEILERLAQTNLEPQPGYGGDEYCRSAAEKIKAACRCHRAQVEFLAGGTQTNAVVIASMLRDHEGVVSAVTGHINGHEAGAVEYTGHKVLPLPQQEGKLDASDLRRLLLAYHGDASREHMVCPGMVYLSFPTEYGTLYSKAELEAISTVCREYEIPLFVDGARLGYGLMSRANDVTLPELAKLADVFYIGGTKVGALCGEAVVFTRDNRPPHFLTSVKKRGALLAKGRLLGVQFDTLFTGDLYFELGRRAIERAEELKDILRETGQTFFLESPTNQQFVVMEDEKLARLSKVIRACFWEKPDGGHTVVRFATSWSTTREDLDALRRALLEL